MEMSLGDLADRFVINTRKKRLLPEAVSDPELRELQFSIIEVLGRVMKDETVFPLFLSDLVQLSEVNNAIWELEFKLKTGKEKEEDYAVLGARAVKIRNLNIIRVGIKNRMNQYSGTGFTDVKVAHCSEEGGNENSL